MDVIIIGVYSTSDKAIVDDLVSKINNLEIIWDYSFYELDSSKGIELFKNRFELPITGILLEKNRGSSFSSYSLIYEVSESVEGSENKTPLLFQFLSGLGNDKIKKMVIAFADEWDEKSLVKIESCSSDSLIDRLNSYYVWCESYVNLVSNTEIRGDDYPLILLVE
jgi:hypothetical protein